jgi:hypothetical protein
MSYWAEGQRRQSNLLLIDKDFFQMKARFFVAMLLKNDIKWEPVMLSKAKHLVLRAEE